MDQREKDAFSHKDVWEYSKVVGEYEFYICPDEPTKIKVKITEDERGRFTYETSHAIKTPSQAAPYHSSIKTLDTLEQALAKAVEDLTSFYDSAIEEGHAPSSDWFVANTR